MSECTAAQTKDSSHDNHNGGDKNEDIPLPPTEDVHIPEPIKEPPDSPGKTEDPDRPPIGEPTPVKEPTRLV